MTSVGLPRDELLALSRKEEFLNNEVLHIGGGSNLLFLEDFGGLVLHSAIKGIKEYRKDDETVYAIAGAGEKWTDFVDWCLERNLAGVENLAHIPGEVGLDNARSSLSDEYSAKYLAFTGIPKVVKDVISLFSMISTILLSIFLIVFFQKRPENC